MTKDVKPFEGRKTHPTIGDKKLAIGAFVITIAGALVVSVGLAILY